MDEWFKCPLCNAFTYVIWDPGQTERDLDCIACRADTLVMEPVFDGQGNPVMAQGPDGPVQVTRPVRGNRGGRRRITKGGGVSAVPPGHRPERR